MDVALQPHTRDVQTALENAITAACPACAPLLQRIAATLEEYLASSRAAAAVSSDELHILQQEHTTVGLRCEQLERDLHAANTRMDAERRAADARHADTLRACEVWKQQLQASSAASSLSLLHAAAGHDDTVAHSLSVIEADYRDRLRGMGEAVAALRADAAAATHAARDAAAEAARQRGMVQRLQDEVDVARRAGHAAEAQLLHVSKLLADERDACARKDAVLQAERGIHAQVVEIQRLRMMSERDAAVMHARAATVVAERAQAAAAHRGPHRTGEPRTGVT